MSRSERASVRNTACSLARAVALSGHIDQRIEMGCGDTDHEHRDIGQFSGAARLTWRHVPRPDAYDAREVNRQPLGACFKDRGEAGEAGKGEGGAGVAATFTALRMPNRTPNWLSNSSKVMQVTFRPGAPPSHPSRHQLVCTQEMKNSFLRSGGRRPCMPRNFMRAGWVCTGVQTWGVGCHV